MDDNDRLHRFLLEGSRVRGEHIHLDATWRAILGQADYPPAVRFHLGQAMAAVALLRATLAAGTNLTLQIRGSGPLHLLVAQCRDGNRLRGLARWSDTASVPEPGTPLAQVFGVSYLVMTLDTGSGQPYQGIAPLDEATSIGSALQGYFERSDQLPTRLWLTTDANAVAGLLIQETPLSAEAAPEADPDAWNRATHLASTVTEGELLGLSAAELLRRLFYEETVRLFEPEWVSFRCSCSRARCAQLIQQMGHDEAQALLAEQGQITIDCEFCNTRYTFDAVDAASLFQSPSGMTPGDTRRH